MRKLKGFADDFNRDLRGAIWTLPTGEDVLVYQKPFGGGFLLYRKDEWNTNNKPTWEADEEGAVLRDGQYVAYHDPAWVIPQAIREHSLSC